VIPDATPQMGWATLSRKHLISPDPTLAMTRSKACARQILSGCFSIHLVIWGGGSLPHRPDYQARGSNVQSLVPGRRDGLSDV
jgi:hypothetical protein